MATNTTDTDEKSTGIEETSDGLADEFARSITSFTVGTDDEFRSHHYHRGADTVVVVSPDGDVEHREYLDGGLVEEWVAHVEEACGWIKFGQLASAGIKADKQRKLGDQ